LRSHYEIEPAITQTHGNYAKLKQRKLLMPKAKVKVKTPKAYTEVTSKLMYSKTKQIAYVVNALIGGKGIWSTIPIVHACLGIKYIKQSNSDTGYGYFQQTGGALRDFAKVFKLSGKELYELQKNCEEMNDYSLYGINVNSKAFKQVVAGLSKPKKKLKAKVSKAKNADNDLAVETTLKLIEMLGTDAMPEIIKQARKAVKKS
tara:strand:- start:1474 stop:2082 length:609 start_codon:yes stop_codon:yes gene_type:complete